MITRPRAYAELVAEVSALTEKIDRLTRAGDRVHGLLSLYASVRLAEDVRTSALVEWVRARDL